MPKQTRAQWWFSSLVLLTWLIWIPKNAQAAASQPASTLVKSPKAWHASNLRRACGAQHETIVQLLRYDLTQMAPWAGLTTAVLKQKKGSAKGTLRAVMLLYKWGKGGAYPGPCVTLQRAVCAAPKVQCRLQARAARLFGLGTNLTLKPAAGSWYETALPSPKTTPKNPVLLMQSSFSFGPKGARQTRTWSHLVRLHTNGRATRVFRDLSLELWSPKHQALRRLEAGGIRTESLHFRKRLGMPPELTVIKKGIPTALNRCICKRLDQSRRYRLGTKGFRRIHAM